MSYSRAELESRSVLYATKAGASLEKELGFGVHGIVWSTDRVSAVKIHAPDSPYYRRERDIYLRLQDRRVNTVRGFAVPQLLSFDDELWAFEISLVRPPFVLDFAGAYLDSRPDYSEETLAEWSEAKREQFGEDWSLVQRVLAALTQYGIYMSDVSPSNIRCRAEDAKP